MPKRLIFVDDEALVLQGLRRALHGMRQEWDMHFVESAAAALEALDKDHYDALITDMRMPVMDGVTLLEQVKERHPDVVRVVLSGQASRDAVLRSIAPAHQFLSKPCDPQELSLRLTQAFAMRDLLSNEPLKRMIARLRTIPSLPTLYGELTAELRTEESSVARIEKIISKDVGMAAKILQLANSAFIGVRGRVSSLLQAITLIGTGMVRNLVLSVHVFSQFDNAAIAKYLPQLWQHSVTVGSLAQRIAKSENQTIAVGEESFTAGLLHDLGKVVLLAEMPNEYRQILDQPQSASGSILLLETERFGCTHAEVGAYLVSIWGLPAPLAQAIAFHHRPATIPDCRFSPLTAVHAADAIASSLDPFPLNRDVELDLNYLETLGLRDKEPMWRSFYEECTAPKPKGGVRESKNPVCG